MAVEADYSLSLNTKTKGRVEITRPISIACAT